MSPRIKTLNRAQVIALYALSMELGPGTEFEILTTYTVGNVLVEARNVEGRFQYTLPTEGGSRSVPIRREQVVK